VEEFEAREIPVKVRFRGQLKGPQRLKDYRVVPDRVWIIAYKSQLNGIASVSTEEVDLDGIASSRTLRVALKQTRNILKFRDRRDVDLVLELESQAARAK
jgi:YbbR domain-containing protein